MTMALIPENGNELYDEESWKSYMATIQKIKRSNNAAGVHDYSSYVPSPDEISRRAEDLRWLQSQGFSRSFIHSVMYHGDPSIYAVVYAIEHKGFSVEKTESLLKPEDADERVKEVPVSQRKMRRAAKKDGPAAS